LKFGDEELTGKELGPIRFSFNNEKARDYVGIARRYLGDMKQRMQLADITQLYGEKLLQDGTIIRMWSNKNGAADIDLVDIMSPINPEEIKMLKVIILGYILRDYTGFYIKLPNGEESGPAPIDNPARLGENGNYTNHPAFTYNGYPDFGGCKRVPRNALDSDGNPTVYASAEFEELLISDETTTFDYVTPDPPEGSTWAEIYDPYWVEKDDFTEVNGPNYSSDFTGSAVTVKRREDGQGLEIYNWHKLENGVRTQLAESEVPADALSYNDIDNYPWDGFYMIPGQIKTGYSAQIYADQAAYWGYEFTTTVYDFVLTGPGTGEPEHKWDLTESQVVNFNQATLTVPMTVAAGLHQFVMRKYPPGFTTPNVATTLWIYTDNGIFKRTIDVSPPDGFDADGSVNEYTGLTIKVGIEGTLDELIF